MIHTVRPTPAACAAAGGSVYFGVPTVWSRLTADASSARALAGARLLVSGSAALPVRVFDSLRALTGLAPVERYGTSETLITLSTRADGERRPGWVGQPLPGVHTRLRDEHGVQVPADGRSIGELQLRTPTLFDSDLNRPEATAASWTVDGWLRTGDVAVIERTGFHRIVGRKSTDLGDASSAYVVGAELDGVDLSGFAAEALSVHKRPRGVRVVDDLPRNAMGKVQKKLLGGHGRG